MAVRDGSVVALKCFRQGSNYDGAIQRERFILDTYSHHGTNIVTSHATINYRGYTLFVLELLQDNVRQVGGGWWDISVSYLTLLCRLYSRMRDKACLPG